MIGQTISHYRILEKLGEGGMGVVYKATDTTLDRPVALKFLPPGFSADTEAKARFVKEAKAASALQHHNICTIHEISETPDGQAFLSMDWYDGESLAAKIRRGPLPVRDAVDYALQIAAGLSKAHEKAITHRDIKPANIIITKDGVAKIMDFGLAKRTGQTQLTTAGSTVGTLPYMSPEQATGGTADHRSDIWSFGVLLYEMITAHLPFRSDYAQAVVYAILNETPPPVTSMKADLPQKVQDIISRCLAKSASDRYQSMDSVISALTELTQEEKGSAKKPLKPRIPAWGWVAMSTVALIACYLLFIRGPSSSDRRSIAVLPLQNMSDSKEDEYFSDGMTEDITTQLSKIGDLRVISRTSTIQYKDTKKSLKEIGSELDVAAILEGSVRRAGNRVRIVVQLIDASTDEHLWAETYDRELTDIFNVQAEVAIQIAHELRATLTSDEKERIDRPPTDNLTAYDFYLQGRNRYNRFSREDNETAIEFFQKSLAIDPAFALGYAGLADAYAKRTSYFGLDREWVDSAIAAAQTAIALDPSSGEAYKALGLAYGIHGKFSLAIEAYHKAVELHSDPAVGNLGDILCMKGRLVEGVRWRRKGLALSRTSAIRSTWLGTAYRYLTDDEKAGTFYRRALELQPDLVETHSHLLRWYLEKGEVEHANSENKRILEIDGDSLRFLMTKGELALRFGDVIVARKLLEEYSRRTGKMTFPLAEMLMGSSVKDSAADYLRKEIKGYAEDIEHGNENPWVKFDIARRYASLGNNPEALAWLKKAVDDGWTSYRFALSDYAWGTLKDHTEFKRIMSELKQKVYAMKQEVEEEEASL